MIEEKLKYLKDKVGTVFEYKITLGFMVIVLFLICLKPCIVKLCGS